jgi:hypothetical protein
MGEVIELGAWGTGIPQTLTSAQAVALIRHLVNEGDYRLTEHALERMDERHITTPQVLSVLRSGSVISGPAKNEHGNWQIQLSDIAAGEQVTVTAVIDSLGVRRVVLIAVVVTVF